jgi:hypothetical protein
VSETGRDGGGCVCVRCSSMIVGVREREREREASLIPRMVYS